MRRLSVAEKETRAKSTFIQIDPQIRLKILLFNSSNKVAKKKADTRKDGTGVAQFVEQFA